jgi:hypothetical protein
MKTKNNLKDRINSFEYNRLPKEDQDKYARYCGNTVVYYKLLPKVTLKDK